MDSILKSLKKGKLTSKHCKLSEYSVSGGEKRCLKEGVTFVARYLGSVLVEELQDEADSYAHAISPEAVNTIVTMSKASNKKLPCRSILISHRGIVVTDNETSTVFTDLDIHRISFCTADKHHERVFAYVARSTENETMECHAFLCSKRKVAEAITITVAQAFHLAKEESERQEDEEREKRLTLDRSTDSDSSSSIKSAPDVPPTVPVIPTPSELPPVPPRHGPFTKATKIPSPPPNLTMGFEDNFTPPQSHQSPRTRPSPLTNGHCLGFEDNFTDFPQLSQPPVVPARPASHRTPFTLDMKTHSQERDVFHTGAPQQRANKVPTVDDLLCL